MFLRFIQIIVMLLNTFSAEQPNLIDQNELDMVYMQIGYINLSNVLYKRITQNNIKNK